MLEPKIYKPIFILGVQRSGTTWLARAVSQHPEVAYWHEPRYVWILGNYQKKNDVLTEHDLTPKIKSNIEKKFRKYLLDRGKKRLCEKTPSNCLRIPFIYAAFPDAKIILILRDGRSVLRSTQEKIVTNTGLGLTWKNVRRKVTEVPIWDWYLLLPRAGSFVKKLLGIKLQYAGVKPPGWNEWVGKFPVHILVAHQWTRTIEIAVREGRKLPEKNYLELRYEELISAPEEQLSQLASFLEIENPECILEYIRNTADSSRTDKWTNELDEKTLDEVREIMEPIMSKLGYNW